MRTSTTIGERFPATSAHLLAMQRMATQTQADEDEEARTLALPGSAAGYPSPNVAPMVCGAVAFLILSSYHRTEVRNE